MDHSVSILWTEALLGLLAGFFGILAARASRGGTLASALTLIVVGQILKSLDHLLLALDRLFGINFFVTLFGHAATGTILEISTIASLAFSTAGFYKIWKLTRPST